MAFLDEETPATEGGVWLDDTPSGGAFLEDQPETPLSQFSSLMPTTSMGWTGQPSPAPEQPDASIPRLVDIEPTMFRGDAQGPQGTSFADLAEANPPDKPYTQEEATAANKAAWEAAKSSETIPRITVNPDDNPVVAVGKEIVNLGSGVVNFAVGPLGPAASLAGIAAPTTTAAGFSIDMLHSLGQQALDTYGNWFQMTPAQKAAAVTDMAGTGIFAALTGHAAVNGTRANLGRLQERMVPGSVEMPQIETLGETAQRAQLIDRLNPTEAPTEPAAPDIAELGKNPTGKDALGNPTGTKYHATPEDWAELQELKKIKPVFDPVTSEVQPEYNQARARIEAIKNERYGSTMPVEPKAESTPKPKTVMEEAAEDRIRQETALKEEQTRVADLKAKGETAELPEHGIAVIEDGKVQIDLIKNGESIDSGSPAELRAQGYNVPDYEKLPKARYTAEEAAKLLKQEPPLITPEERANLIRQGPPSETVAKMEAEESAYRNRQPKQTAVELQKEYEAQQLAKAKIPAGPGAQTKSSLGEAGSQLSQLAQSLPKVEGATPVLAPLAGKIGDTVKSAGETVGASWNKLKTFLRSEPRSTSHTEALGEWGLQRQESSRDAYKAWQTIKKQIPDVEKRGAIAVWADAGGDVTLLKKAADTLPEKYARVYRKALAMTPEEINVAKNIRSYFDRRLQDAVDAGILEDGVENYVRRLYEKDSDWKSAVLSELQYLNTGKPGFAKERIFDYDFEAIGQGYRPILDFAARVLEYDQSLNHAIADRAFVKAEMGLKMKDGRPRIDIGGSGTQLPEGQSPPDTILIKPSFKPTDTENPQNNRSDYRPFNHPAFRKWKWATTDSNGKPIFVQGDVLVHPDALPEMKRLLERSRIREHPVGRVLLKTSDTIKQTMLDLSGFHPVQIGVHALEHRTLPLKDIDLKDPVQRGLVRGGLVIASDKGFTDWSEGLHGTSLTKHIPKLGPKLVDFHDWMFKDWIPTVKMNMALHALERNKARYPKLSEFNLNKLTAEQANAAFGGLNYKMLGRSQTMQDFLRLTLLAPDFLEARGRFVGQALKGHGQEQLTALLFGAAVLYTTARVLNQISDGNPHWEIDNAFSVIHNGHAYGLRTIQGDILHLMKKPGQFWYHRLNPVTTRALMELISGRNYFGQKRGLGQQALDEIKTVIPISLKGLTEGRSQNLLESALSAFGLTTKRYTAISEIHKLGEDWKAKNKVRSEPGEFIYDQDKDPLYRLKQTLQYNDTAAGAGEIKKVIDSKVYDRQKLREYFKRYQHSPFTGSMANDQKFERSLNGSQKDLLAKARLERVKIAKQFSAAMSLVK